MSGTATVELVNHRRGTWYTQQKPGYECRFRPPGAPAGSFPHTPWWHCTFHDPYERANVWSHLLPGLVFLVLGVCGLLGVMEGGGALGLFGACAACTHLCSAITHIWPDSRALEKLDHLGIVVCIIGTPVSALLALEHGHLPMTLRVVAAMMVAAAFLPPLLRTLGFAAGVTAIFVLHVSQLLRPAIVAQLVLYGLGGVAFIRNSGHQRWAGFADHHFLHYFVTVACFLHTWFIWSEMKVYHTI